MRTRIAAGIVALSIGVVGVAAGPASGALNKSKPISSSYLKALEKEVGKGKKLTYEATYKTTSAGKTTVITIAQAPPKSAFLTGSGQVIDTGTKTYYCSKTGTSVSCLSSSGLNPFADLEDLFSPTAALAAFNEAKEGLVERSLGIKTSSSTSKFGGQSSTCVTVSVKKNVGKYCVTKQGLLSYAGSSSFSFVLTKFTSKPSSSLFQLPAGATTVTLPGGASIP